MNNVSSKKIKKDESHAIELNQTIIQAIQSVKGKKIILLDLRNLKDTPTDFFIICEGDSSVQVKAIAQRIYTEVKEKTGELPNHIEGKDKALWILVDYFTTVVHIFHPETREFYELEELWSDAKSTIIEAL